MNLCRTHVLFAVRFSRNRANTYRSPNAAARSKILQERARGNAGKTALPARKSVAGNREIARCSAPRAPEPKTVAGTGCTGHCCCTALLQIVSIVGLKIGNGAAVQDRLQLTTLQYIKPTATCDGVTINVHEGRGSLG